MTATMRRHFVWCSLVLHVAWLSSVWADDAGNAEQAAIRAAVDRVAPAVVRIETVGGQEFVNGIRFGAAPTTGLVIEPDGYIISSVFNFLHHPDSILVRLSDGTRKAARMIAADHSRMLVLLKVDVDRPLQTCESAPTAQLRNGQWTIAIGRTFETERPNIAVGILSARNRVWGKAIQTDAAVSPNNYGGPLIDIHGRVLGVLVPLSPDSEDVVAGVEWYDSGIGFAVPLEQIQNVLPRLKKGEDLYPGRAGIAMKGPNLYTGEPIVASCHPKGPATAAGIRAGDRILEIDGQPMARSADVRREIGYRYAGETMRFTVFRGSERVECAVQLVKELEPIEQEEVDGE